MITKSRSSYTWDGREGHEGCLDEMFNALLQERKAETDCSDNIKACQWCLSAGKCQKENFTLEVKYFYMEEFVMIENNI